LEVNKLENYTLDSAYSTMFALAEKGLPNAQFQAGKLLYELGQRNNSQEFLDKAKVFLQNSARQGHRAARSILSRHYNQNFTGLSKNAPDLYSTEELLDLLFNAQNFHTSKYLFKSSFKFVYWKPFAS